MSNNIIAELKKTLHLGWDDYLVEVKCGCVEQWTSWDSGGGMGGGSKIEKVHKCTYHGGSLLTHYRNTEQLFVLRGDIAKTKALLARQEEELQKAEAEALKTDAELQKDQEARDQEALKQRLLSQLTPAEKRALGFEK